MTEAESRFAARALRRKTLFLILSVAGLAVAALLSVYYAFRITLDPAFPIGPRAVIVVLVLLNARQNLRQYRFAGILEQLLPAGAGSAAGAAVGRGGAPDGRVDAAGARGGTAGAGDE